MFEFTGLHWCCLPLTWLIFSDDSQVHVWGSDSESYRPNSVECLSGAKPALTVGGGGGQD